jgi:hypothetical protein
MPVGARCPGSSKSFMMPVISSGLNWWTATQNLPAPWGMNNAMIQEHM